MAKRLLFLLCSFAFLAFFLAVKPAHAIFDTLDTVNVANLAKRYCDLRKGNQVNLETWYSGKCSKDWQEKIGFADLFLLDFITEPLTGFALDGSGPVFNDGSMILSPFGTFLAHVSTSLPASSTQYIAYVSQNLNKHSIVTPAYAQSSGFGFRSLGPVLNVWRAFRNVVYLLFVLAFVLYGFMMMFRTKINPQAVIGIQNAIPSLIITLLLITFSYAIAGLIIDLTYVFQEVILNALFSQITQDASVKFSWLGLSGGFNTEDVKNFLSQLNLPPEIGGLLSGVVGAGAGAAIGDPQGLASVFIGRFGGIFLPLMYILMSVSIGGAVGRVISVLAPLQGNPIMDGLITGVVTHPILIIIIWLVLFIAILFTFFKIVWMLIKSYVMVIFQTIFAPFILLRGILPGTDAFGEWSRNIVSNMAVFPATIVCFLLSFTFLGPITVGKSTALWAIPMANFFVPGPDFSLNLYNAGDSSGAIAVPPPLGNIGTGTSGEGVLALIGIGIFLMIPKIVDMLQEALKVPPFKHGTAIAEALSFGSTPITGPLNFARGRIEDYAKAKGNEYVAGRVQEVQNTVTRPRPVDPAIQARLDQLNSSTGRSGNSPDLDNMRPG